MKIEFDKTLPGSDVKVYTPEYVKDEMKKMQDVRREAGLPYWSQERIFQECFKRHFRQLFDNTVEAIRQLQES